MSQEYELINYSEHGSVVDGVLYSCDFSDKSSLSTSATTKSSQALTLDDVTALGNGRRAEKARQRLNASRKSLEDKHAAKRALDAALMLAVPASVLDASYLAEEMSKAEGLVTRMGLKRVAAETSVVSIPLSKTRKVEKIPETKTNSVKALIGSQDKGKANATLTVQSKNGAKKNSNLKEATSVHLKGTGQQHKGAMNKTKTSLQIKSEMKPPPAPSRVTENKDSDSPSSSSLPKEPRVPCLCKRSASSVVGSNGKGWEGTATLGHGSKVRFGCVQFVLSLSGRPGHSELVDGLCKVANSTLTILNNSDQSRLSN